MHLPYFYVADLDPVIQQLILQSVKPSFENVTYVSFFKKNLWKKLMVNKVIL